MPKLTVWLLFAGFLLVAGRYAFISVDDGQRFAEVANVPTFMNDQVLRAHSIGSTVTEYVQRSGCAVEPNGVEVDLAEPVAQGQGQTIKYTQQVETHVRCKRRNAFFKMATHDFTTTIVAIASADSRAGHWPEKQ